MCVKLGNMYTYYFSEAFWRAVNLIPLGKAVLVTRQKKNEEREEKWAAEFRNMVKLDFVWIYCFMDSAAFELIHIVS